MDMEDLLCPQISMDVDETPLELGLKDNDKDETGSTNSDDIPLEIKIKILLEVEEFDAAQIPEPLTEEEEALKNTVFNLGPSVQFMRLHCTSCNVHLGSAPTNQFNRFIHPLLHVLLCKKCYDFYSSGDFEKDEDGSELYCRWCGQGGKVMCCSDCCFVFCQKCVRSNLGKKILDGIKNSEEWKCFVCNPQQLINLKLICHSLYQYVLAEIQIAKESKLESALTIDHSMCCKPTNRPVKRKRSESTDDANYHPNTDVVSVKKMKNVLKTAMTSFGAPPTKSTNGQMGINPAFKPVTIPGVRGPGMPILNKYLKVKPMARQPMGSRPRFPLITPRSMSMVGTSGIRNPIMANQLARPVGTQNYIPLNTPPVRVIPSKSGPHVMPVVNCVPANLTPGTKHNWFEQAASITSNITNQLSRKLASFSNEQKNATTIEQLASIHNKLQELLSSSVNSLIHVRKNLRNEFLNDLNKMKFAKNPPPLAAINAQPQATLAPEDDDDDVILISNEEDPLADNTPEIPTVQEEQPPPPPPQIEHDPNKPRIFLKVKPVSSLMDASRLPPPPPSPEAVPEHIDLCDDDEEECSKYEENRVSEIEASTQEEKEPEVDLETSRQIKRALSESKYEAVVEDNLKVKVVPGLLSKKAMKRMVTVRVIVDPKWIPKRKFNPPGKDRGDNVSASINKSVVCDIQEIRSEAGDDRNKVAEIFSDEEVDDSKTKDAEAIGLNDIDANEVCEIVDDDDVVGGNDCTEQSDAIVDRDKAIKVDGGGGLHATDKDLDKTTTSVEEVEKVASTVEELETTSTTVEELEKSTTSVEEVEKTSTTREELEKSTTSLEEVEKTSTIVEELEKSTMSVEEVEKTSTTVEELEKSTMSAEEVVKTSTTVEELERSTTSLEEVEKTSTKVDEFEKSTTSVEEVEKPVSSTEEIVTKNDSKNEGLCKNDSTNGELNKSASSFEENKDNVASDLEKVDSPEAEVNKDVDPSPGEVNEAMDVDKSPSTELKSGQVNGSDSEKVKDFSDDFNPFRNVENGDDIYDRRKELNAITDKVTEFEVSTDPVTTTDSGIEVDAK